MRGGSDQSLFEGFNLKLIKALSIILNKHSNLIVELTPSNSNSGLE